MKTKETSIEALWNRWSAGLSAELLNQDGIKAQFAAATALVTFLSDKHKDGSWKFLAVPVGSFEDRNLGIDGYLVNGETKSVYAVDFSLEAQNNPKGNKATAKWLVHLKREWFEQRPDGIWVMRPSCLSALFRAFLPTLTAGPVPWQPLFEDTMQRPS